MRRDIHSWHSPRMGIELEIACYGHYGHPILFFPTASADFLEYERFLMFKDFVLGPYIDAGVIKCYSINSPNKWSWTNDDVPTWRAVQIQNAFNGYVTEEVVPFIRNDCQNPSQRIAVTGASLGNLHAANQFFRRPDLFDTLLGMSGGFDLKPWCKDGFFNEDCYYNSPLDFVQGLDGEHYWTLRNHCSINIIGGQGAYENPESLRKMSRVLTARSIPHNLDLWGHDVNHDWPWWRKMLPYYVERLWT